MQQKRFRLPHMQIHILSAIHPLFYLH